MSRLSLPLATCLWLLALGAPAPSAAEPDSAVDAAEKIKAHELGWVCVEVSDVRLAKVGSYNMRAKPPSTWVTPDRMHIEQQPGGPGGRVCLPAVVAIGGERLPENTLLFEREVLEDGVAIPAVAEVVLTPELATLTEHTMQIVGNESQWTRAGGVWTFNAATKVNFEARVARGLDGDGGGPPPPDVFRSAVRTRQFAEPCRPMKLTWRTVGNIGVFDKRTGKVVPRGVEPFPLDNGDIVSRCDGLSADGTLVAVAKRLENDEADVVWFLLPSASSMEPLEPDIHFTVDNPLGGYHVCYTPSWTTALLEDVPIAGIWELLSNGEWRELPSLSEDLAPELQVNVPRAVAGTPTTLLAHRDTWALVRFNVDNTPRVFAIPAEQVALPSGPSSSVRSVASGLCQWPKGEWRATAETTQAFKVSRDAVGAELTGLWLELPAATRMLMLCQHRHTKCAPIYVGGSDSDEEDRMVVVRYAGHVLAVRERHLRDRSSGVFETRRERPAYYAADETIRDVRSGWALGFGPGGKISFMRSNDHAWTIDLRIQNLVGKGTWGLEAGAGIGGSGSGTYLSVHGGAGTLLKRWDDLDLEIRAAVLGELDFFFANSGGIAFDLTGKAQLRWTNDFTPLSFELGLNLGYGGTFGANGAGGFRLGMPMRLIIEIVEF